MGGLFVVAEDKVQTLKKRFVGVSAHGAIKTMLFVLKLAIINRAEGERSYIVTFYNG